MYQIPEGWQGVQAGPGVLCCCGVNFGHWGFVVFSRCAVWHNPSSELQGAVRAFGDPLENRAHEGLYSHRAWAPALHPLWHGAESLVCSQISPGCTSAISMVLPLLPGAGHEWGRLFSSSDVLLSQFSPNFACSLFSLILFCSSLCHAPPLFSFPLLPL